MSVLHHFFLSTVFEMTCTLSRTQTHKNTNVDLGHHQCRRQSMSVLHHFCFCHRRCEMMATPTPTSRERCTRPAAQLQMGELAFLFTFVCVCVEFAAFFSYACVCAFTYVFFFILCVHCLEEADGAAASGWGSVFIYASTQFVAAAAAAARTELFTHANLHMK
jgi:hypothetical protein